MLRVVLRDVLGVVLFAACLVVVSKCLLPLASLGSCVSGHGRIALSASLSTTLITSLGMAQSIGDSLLCVGARGERCVFSFIFTFDCRFSAARSP